MVSHHAALTSAVAPAIREVEDEEDEETQQEHLEAMLYHRFIIKCQKLQTLIFAIGNAMRACDDRFRWIHLHCWLGILLAGYGYCIRVC